MFVLDGICHASDIDLAASNRQLSLREECPILNIGMKRASVIPTDDATAREIYCENTN